MRRDDNKKIRLTLITRVSLIFTISLILASIVAAIISSISLYRGTVMESSDVARTALVSAQELVREVDPFFNFEYDQKLQKELHQSFRRICSRTQLRYMYLYTIDEDQVVHYVICAADADEDDRLMNELRGYGTSNSRALLDSEKNALNGNLDGGSEYVSNEFGSVYMWIMPVTDDDGDLKAFLGADYSIDHLVELAKENAYLYCAGTIFAMILSLIIASRLIKHSTIMPIKQLSDQMTLFAKNKELVPIGRNTYFEDEITDIESSFSEMVKEISDYTENIEALTRDKVQNQTQMEIARNIQCGVVPQNKELLKDLISAFGFSHPAKEVGGDFYEMFELDDDRLCILIGDVSGKGITAALFMMMIKSAIREKIRSGREVADALNEVNCDVCASNPEFMFATVFAAIYDRKNAVLSYANAGHNPPILIKDDPAELEVEPGIAIGMFEDIVINPYELKLENGEGILLYTDGITESINKDSEQFGVDRLKAEVKRSYGNKSSVAAKDFVMEVSDAVKVFTGDLEQFDDMTMVALVVSKDEEKEIYETSLLPELSEFGKIKDKLLNTFISIDKAKKAALACEEAFVNIVSYSGADRISFTLSRDQGFVVVSYCDNGKEFDPTGYGNEVKEFEELDSGGMGIFLIRDNSDELHYDRKDDKNILTLKFKNTDPEEN